MPQCEGLTRDGNRCKRQCSNGTKCHIHEGDSCPVCMTQMSESNSRTLECGHVFHIRCLERWKRRNSTCPMCRAPFDQPMYRVKINIEPVGFEHETLTSNIQTFIDAFGIDTSNADRFFSTISFSVTNNTDLRSILEEIGLGIPPGMDFTGFDTESRTEL